LGSFFITDPDNDWGELQELIDLNAVATLDAGRTYIVNQTIHVPASRTINLNGATIIQDTLPDDGIYSLFEMAATVHSVEIFGGTIEGRHSGGWTNSEMTAIQILGGTCHDIDIHDCTFRNLVGFSVHSVGGDNINVFDCQMINCGNGLNVNADNAELSRNHFVDSEGIEASGSYVSIQDNTFENALAGAISAGGDTGMTIHPGAVVSGNTISGVTGNGTGIVVADGMHGATVSDNIVSGCQYGIRVSVTVGFFNTVADTLIQGNTVRDCNIGIYLPHGGDRITGTVVDDNLIESECGYGMLISAASLIATNNDARNCGVHYDIALTPSSLGMEFAPTNLYSTILDQRPI
jgi:hypothetical protein